MPKLVKVACLLRPSQGLSSLHSERKSPGPLSASVGLGQGQQTEPHVELSGACVVGSWDPGLCSARTCPQQTALSELLSTLKP